MAAAPVGEDGKAKASTEGAPEPAMQNTVTGDLQDSVQAGVVGTINYYKVYDKVDLFARQVNDVELADVRTQFLSPENFEHAEHILKTNQVVLLLGVGAGRTFAGRRLLDGQACNRIVHLSPERSMGSVGEGDMRPGDGYLWDLSEQGARPFKGWQFARIRQFVQQTGHSRLVIVLNDRSQVPPDADGLWVELRPPNAVAVGEAAIDRDWSKGDDKPRRILVEEFANLLPPDAAPERALLAADLAMRVADGLDLSEAKRDFEQGFGREVAEIMAESWDSMEYTLMFTVALLQNEPFDEVIAEAYNLDESVRRKELREGKKLRPRKAFAKPNDQLLRTIGARTDMRDNPSHPGLKVETVRFARRGWAEAVLCRIWRYYHVDHDELIHWMCGSRMSERHFGASVWALCTLISKVPAGDRLRELHRLVRRGRFYNWRLAAATLVRLEGERGFRDLVRQALAEWSTSDIAYEKCAAVVFYGYRFDRSDPQLAMAKIAEIAREKMPSVHDTTVGTVLRLMTSADQLKVVLRSVVAWVDDGKSARDKDGLRFAALEIGAYMLRLTSAARSLKLDLDPVDIAERYPDECRLLVERIMDDDHYSRDLIHELLVLAEWHQFIAEDKNARQDATELVRITRLLVSDLRWRGRHRVVAQLCRQHSTLRPQLRRIFRTAYKVEKSGLCGGDIVTANAAEPEAADVRIAPATANPRSGVSVSSEVGVHRRPDPLDR